ncbi:hypothetical protein JXB37_03855 [candidate division WOR-3 bacterium]|nr:hypothetical protein [candidate division WOR-3 bacterium]
MRPVIRLACPASVVPGRTFPLTVDCAAEPPGLDWVMLDFRPRGAPKAYSIGKYVPVAARTGSRDPTEVSVARRITLHLAVRSAGRFHAVAYGRACGLVESVRAVELDAVPAGPSRPADRDRRAAGAESLIAAPARGRGS